MDTQICESEWKLMEVLWAGAPKTLMELVRAMRDRTGWAKSTVTTMVARMEQKGLLRHEDGGRAKLFFPPSPAPGRCASALPVRQNSGGEKGGSRFRTHPPRRTDRLRVNGCGCRGVLFSPAPCSRKFQRAAKAFASTSAPHQTEPLPVK